MSLPDKGNFFKNIELMRKKILFVLILFMQGVVILFAQNDSLYNQTGSKQQYEVCEFRPVTQSLLVGIGGANMLDTYLSPLDYSGLSLALRTEREKVSKYSANRLNRHIFDVLFLSTDNVSGNGIQVAGLINYSYSMLWQKELFGALTIGGGPLAGFDLGFIYNMRNGNNPASAIANIYLGVAALVKYRFNIDKLTRRSFFINLHWDLPVVKTFFCPNYGQSYYEIFSLGNTDNTVHFGSFNKGFDSDLNLSVDVPMFNGYLKLGVYNKVRNMEANSLKRRIISTDFMIGYSRRLVLVK